MSKKTIFNLLLILVLLFLFPLLWLFNQRLNYRKFLTLNTKLTFNANTEKRSELSSMQFILDYLNSNGVEGRFDVDVKSPGNFSVLGRIIKTEQGIVEVYEYSSKKDAAEVLEDLDVKQDTYQYKNILIYNVDQIEKVSRLMGELSD